MKLQPSDQLTNAQVKTGLHLILKDGLATETIEHPYSRYLSVLPYAL